MTQQYIPMYTPKRNKNIGTHKNMYMRTFDQVGGIGGYSLPPHTTKRRTTTNLKTENNPKCQKIEWKSNNQGVKAETFIQTSRRGGDGQPDGEDAWQSGGWRTAQPHICMWINQEEQLWSEHN